MDRRNLLEQAERLSLDGDHPPIDPHLSAHLSAILRIDHSIAQKMKEIAPPPGLVDRILTRLATEPTPAVEAKKQVISRRNWLAWSAAASVTVGVSSLFYFLRSAGWTRTLVANEAAAWYEQERGPWPVRIDKDCPPLAVHIPGARVVASREITFLKQPAMLYTLRVDDDWALAIVVDRRHFVDAGNDRTYAGRVEVGFLMEDDQAVVCILVGPNLDSFTRGTTPLS